MAQANVLSTNFRFGVSNIKDLDKIWTPEISVQGIPWKVRVSKEDSEGKSSLAVYLYCVKNDKATNWFHAASASFKLLSFAANANSIECHTGGCVFDSLLNAWGSRSLISWNDLFDEEKSYVKNDSINLDIEIKAVDSNDATKSNLVCTTVEKCCDEGCSATFRLSVTNVEQFMAVRSPQLMLRNTIWFLTVFKSRHGYIEIRLGKRNVPNGFSCNVRMICKLISTNEGAQKIEQTNSGILDASTYLYARNIASLVELLKPQNGYVQNGCIVIEVELKVNKPEGVVANNNASCAEPRRKQLKIECAICFECLRYKEISSVPCGHTFCTVCITEAIKARPVCPKCNTPAILKDLRRTYLDTLN